MLYRSVWTGIYIDPPAFSRVLDYTHALVFTYCDKVTSFYIFPCSVLVGDSHCYEAKYVCMYVEVGIETPYLLFICFSYSTCQYICIQRLIFFSNTPPSIVFLLYFEPLDIQLEFEKGYSNFRGCIGIKIIFF